MATATRNGTRTPPTALEKASVPVVAEIGVTGLKHDAGVIREEWVRALDGPNGIRIFEEMQLDPIVGAMLWAIYTELRRVGYDIEPADETPEAEEVADFIEGCLEDMSSPLEDVIAEALTMLPFGWSYHEIVYKVRRGHVPGEPGKSSQFSDGKLGWRKLPIRAQETLRRWEMDEEGGIAGMVQVIEAAADVTIPVQKALLFRPDAHKNNPQGRSVLRSSYPAWYVRRRLQELEAIGIERDLVGVPKIGVPGEWLGANATAEQQAAVDAYRRIGEQARMDEQACLIWPRSLDANGNELITFELMASPGAKQVDIGPVVQRYNTEILMTLMADVILVGHNTTGTFALATQKYRAFERSLEAFMRSIASVFNRHAIPRLLHLNDIDPELAPKLCFADIEDQDLDVLGKFLTALYGAGAPLFPNQELEAWLFRAAGMPWTPPEERPEDAMPKPAPVAPMPAADGEEPDEPDEDDDIDVGDQPVGARPPGQNPAGAAGP